LADKINYEEVLNPAQLILYHHGRLRYLGNVEVFGFLA